MNETNEIGTLQCLSEFGDEYTPIMVDREVNEQLESYPRRIRKEYRDGCMMVKHGYDHAGNTVEQLEVWASSQLFGNLENLFERIS